MCAPCGKFFRYLSSGNLTEGATPVPIPNTAVKPFKVDGTVVARLWESRTLPDSIGIEYPPDDVGILNA